MNAVPSIRARIDELIAVAKGLALELEATRKQVTFVSDVAQDILKTATALKGDPCLADQLKQH